MIISNGHGEDDVGALLASKLHEKLGNKILVRSLPLVGRGAAYSKRNVEIVASFSSLPSEGLTKYGIMNFFRDLRAGLIGQIREQINFLRDTKEKVLLPLCVGDVFLAYLVFLGLKRKVFLLLVGRTVRTRPFSLFEKAILKKCTQLVWTKDRETCQALSGFLPYAVYVGDPIMDLGRDVAQECNFLWRKKDSFRVIILPGSRTLQLEKLSVLLEAVFLVSQEIPVEWVLVKAPGQSLEELVSFVPDWHCDGDYFLREGLSVRIFRGPLANIAGGADLVVGFGGTANQICAGLGIPVLAVGGKEKKSQKKILGEAVKVVPPEVTAIKRELSYLLSDSEERVKMGQAGRERMGPPGALDCIANQIKEFMRAEESFRRTPLPSHPSG
ncbi:MAG: hypothetical protein J7J32_04665 [Candidatus Atribacteria bacterium]|nr:hypothetical protein [Candidatus Atribacteria bacterium]MCD6349976.1 hypothetical protein [Candidatus Atribacteria bacterium]